MDKDRNKTKYFIPEAPYFLEKAKKTGFCQYLSDCTFPDGFCSNMASCVNVEKCKITGLKTHDCHILLHRVLAAGMRGYLPTDIYKAIAELGRFFRELCSKNLKLSVLNKLEKAIPVILTKLENIFPSAFFDVMVHLAVHLPYEAKLRGPVQYGWMYPIERLLCTLKRFVRNNTRPEGSMAEAYITNECLTFCYRYLDDIVTRFNRP